MVGVGNVKYKAAQRNAQFRLILTAAADGYALTNKKKVTEDVPVNS